MHKFLRVHVRLDDEDGAEKIPGGEDGAEKIPGGPPLIDGEDGAVKIPGGPPLLDDEKHGAENVSGGAKRGADIKRGGYGSAKHSPKQKTSMRLGQNTYGFVVIGGWKER